MKDLHDKAFLMTLARAILERCPNFDGLLRKKQALPSLADVDAVLAAAAGAAGEAAAPEAAAEAEALKRREKLKSASQKIREARGANSSAISKTGDKFLYATKCIMDTDLVSTIRQLMHFGTPAQTNYSDW